MNSSTHAAEHIVIFNTRCSHFIIHSNLLGHGTRAWRPGTAAALYEHQIRGLSHAGNVLVLAAALITHHRSTINSHQHVMGNAHQIAQSNRGVRQRRLISLGSSPPIRTGNAHHSDRLKATEAVEDCQRQCAICIAAVCGTVSNAHSDCIVIAIAIAVGSTRPRT